jgi:iron(III) transport system permease protein
MGRSLKKNLPDFALILYAAIAILPLLFLIFYALVNSTNNFSRQIVNSLPTLLYSIVFSFAIAFISTMIGAIIALSIYGRNDIISKLTKILVLIPLFITPYSTAVSWDKIFVELKLIASVKVFITLVIVYTPIAYIIIFSSLKKMPVTLIEAALIHSSKRKKMLLHIIIPYLKNSIITALSLIFIFAISEFTVPIYFGVNLYSAKIFTEFSAFYNYNLAVVHSFVLLLVILIILKAELKTLGKVPLISTREIKKQKYTLLPNTFFIFSILYVSIIFVLPFFNLSLSIDITSLEKAYNLLYQPIINSIILSLVTSIFIILITIATVTINYVKQKKINAGIIFITPFAVPSIILGISFIYFYNTPALNFIYSSASIIIFALFAKFSYLPYKIISNSINSIDFNSIEVAKIHKFSTMKIIGKIILPQIEYPIIISFLIVFIFSYLEAGISIMLYPPGMQLAIIKVFTLTANSPENLSYALNFLLIVSGLVFAAILFVVSKFYHKIKAT